jgi:hypothetical protein
MKNNNSYYYLNGIHYSEEEIKKMTNQNIHTFYPRRHRLREDSLIMPDVICATNEKVEATYLDLNIDVTYKNVYDLMKHLNISAFELLGADKFESHPEKSDIALKYVLSKL